MKIIKIIFTFCYSSIVLAGLVFFNFKKDQISEIDNRKLTELTATTINEIPNFLDSYIKDRIGFRDLYIESYTEYNDTLFSEMVHPSYDYGKDGYVFFKFGEENENESFVYLFCNYLKEMQDYCNDRDVPFIYCLNPAKATIYPEFLPNGYTYKNKFNNLMIKYLKLFSINYIENISTLTNAKEEIDVFNVKYDAGHWNDWGAFYGTNNLLEKVSQYFPNVTPWSNDDFTVSEINQDTLPVSKFKINENVPDLEPKNTLLDDLTEKYNNIKICSDHPSFGVYDSHQSELPNVLFFHGSYYNSRRKFYQTKFNVSYSVHNYQNVIDLDYYFNLFKPDCVILETAEYATRAAYFSEEGLSSKTLNKPYRTVADKNHCSLNFSDLQGLEILNEPGSDIVDIQFTLDDDYSFGYLLSSDNEFDLLIDNGVAKVSIAKDMWKINNASIELFTN